MKLIARSKFRLPFSLHGLNQCLFARLRYQNLLLRLLDGRIVPAPYDPMTKKEPPSGQVRSRLVEYVCEQLAEMCLLGGGENNAQMVLRPRSEKLRGWAVYVAVVKPDRLNPWEQLDQATHLPKTEAEYQKIMEEIDSLIHIAPDSPEADRLELLALLASDYESKQTSRRDAGDKL